MADAGEGDWRGACKGRGAEMGVALRSARGEGDEGQEAQGLALLGLLRLP